jgi:uncharacterized membrane protein SirB2
MITLSLLIAACFTLVSPQLAPAQHTALMALYDALGKWQPSQRKQRKQRAKKIIFPLQVVLLHCARALWRLQRALAAV